MNREDIALAIAVANFVLTWGVALYMYLANKSKATNARIEKLEDDIDGRLDRHTQAEEAKFAEISGSVSRQSERLRAVEAALQTAPTHDDLGNIHDKINRTLETVAVVAGELKALVSNVHLIHEHLLKGGK